MPLQLSSIIARVVAAAVVALALLTLVAPAAEPAGQGPDPGAKPSATPARKPGRPATRPARPPRNKKPRKKSSGGRTASADRARSGAADASRPLPITIRQLSPQAGPGTGTNMVTIRGAGFHNVEYVTFDGRAAVIKEKSPNLLLVIVPPLLEYIKTDKRVAVAVVRADSSEAVIPDGYTYYPALRVTDVSPKESPTNGGAELEITGEGFTSDTTVIIGGKQAVIRLLSVDRITCVTPPNEIGPAKVEVKNRDGQTAVAPTEFFYRDWIEALEITFYNQSEKSKDDTIFVSVYSSNLEVARATFGKSEPWSRGSMTFPYIFVAPPVPVTDCREMSIRVTKEPDYYYWRMALEVKGKLNTGATLVLVPRDTFYDFGSFSLSGVKITDAREAKPSHVIKFPCASSAAPE
jgi:hypothetical protein